MQYYEQDERRSRMWGFIALAVYLVACVGVMFVTYTISLPQEELGIVVDFGTGDTGLGLDDLTMGETDAVPYVPPVPEVSTEAIMTSDDPEAPAIVAEEQPSERPETIQSPPPTPTTTPQAEPVRQPDSRALFPGRTAGSTATSQGTAGGEGNQGVSDGSPGGNDSAGGSGSSGFTLSGRYLAGNLPRPAYDIEEEGRVVIRITVNAEGAVTRAVYEQAGSTTNNGTLVTAARNAAMRARFTEAEAEVQTGTITYIFRLD